MAPAKTEQASSWHSVRTTLGAGNSQRRVNPYSFVGMFLQSLNDLRTAFRYRNSESLAKALAGNQTTADSKAGQRRSAVQVQLAHDVATMGIDRCSGNIHLFRNFL